MRTILNNFLRLSVLPCMLVVFNVSVLADAEETWHQKSYYLEAISGYNIQNGDIPIGMTFTFQKYRVGPYVSAMYGFRNKMPYSDETGNYNPTRYGWYASAGFSFRVVGDWSVVDAQVYIGPAWRVVTTARDNERWEHWSEEQQNNFNPQLIGRWGGELGVRFGGGRVGGKFATWSGSVGVKMFYIGSNKFEIMPQVGLSIPIGGPLAAAGACALLFGGL